MSSPNTVYITQIMCANDDEDKYEDKSDSNLSYIIHQYLYEKINADVSSFC